MGICKTVIAAFLFGLLSCIIGATNSNEPARPLRAVFMGDSLTAGYQLPKDQAYPNQVAILAQQAGYALAVHNAGVSGDTSSGGLSRLDWNLSQPFDLFVLALGANDGLRGIELSVTRENLRKILQKAKQRNSKAILVVAGMKLPPNYGKQYRTEFEQMYVDIAEEFDALLIPFLLEGVGGVRNLNLADGIHPNAEGHKLVAKNVWQVIQPAL